MIALRIASCVTLPEPDPDAEPLAAALAAAGVEVAVLGWDDPEVDWDAPIPTLLRSTWNYPLAPEAFAAWLRRVGAAAPLWNPLDVVLGNLSKRYLLELPERGVATVPTRWIERAPWPTLASLRGELGATRVVAKPAVGAGSLDTERFVAGEDARFAAHLEKLTARGAALVQPYVESVHDYGERSLVWIDGQISHAVRKTPRFAGDVEQVEGPLPFTDAEAALAAAALAPRTGSLLYARVDLARDAAGAPMVMEVELIEPSLFFAKQPGSADRFVTAVQRRLASAPAR
ncbi:MAG: hypothetical protein R3B48_02865 [Kofleriaceae bacterium]